MAVINFDFKKFNKLILIITREREILTWHDVPMGCRKKDHVRMEFTFTYGFGHASEPAFPYMWQS